VGKGDWGLGIGMEGEKMWFKYIPICAFPIGHGDHVRFDTSRTLEHLRYCWPTRQSTSPFDYVMENPFHLQVVPKERPLYQMLWQRGDQVMKCPTIIELQDAFLTLQSYFRT
jgi:hypothetical protein